MKNLLAELFKREPKVYQVVFSPSLTPGKTFSLDGERYTNLSKKDADTTASELNELDKDPFGDGKIDKDNSVYWLNFRVEPYDKRHVYPIRTKTI